MSTNRTKAELQAELEEANGRIEELEAKLGEIINIADADSDDEDGEDDDFQEEADPDDLD